MPGIRPGDLIILSKGSDRRWFRVRENVTVNRTVKAQELIQQTVNGETISILIPAVKTRTTRLRLDAYMNNSGRRAGAAIWIMPGDAPAISVQFGLRRAATAAARPKMEIWPDDSLDLEPAGNGLITLPPEPGVTQTYVLEDRAGTAYAIKGALDPDAGQFTFEEAANWSEPLVPPVTIYGNVVRLRRGETVLDEVLGDGDRSVPGQVFTLKKSPLTYVPDTSGVTERGYRSTVTLWVDGIRWTEIEDFVTAGPTDAVYVLRQNEDDKTEVVFGDGIQGRRLPTGRGNVIASYRFGAGFASPPARKITQLAKPIAGVTSVVNPTPASPGSDAESAEDVRDNAPALALLLGRIVSIADVQAVARAYPGVITAEARWAWHSERQTAVIEVDCITSGTDLTELKAKIRNLSEPSLQVDVLEAIASSLRLSLTIEFDAATYRAEDVLPAIRSRLMDPESGLLAPANIGIGRPLFRSAIYGEVLAVPGAVAVTGLLANGLPLTDMGLQPDPGHWFDVADGGLVLNGQEDDGDGE